MAVTLYHPALKRTITVPSQRVAEVHKHSGWTETIPRKFQTSTKKGRTDAKSS